MIDLKPDHLEIIQRILAEHIPDAEVRAFGSRVTQTNKDHSDLDLAIVGKQKTTLKTLTTLKIAFEESDLPFRVDVLDWSAISEAFKKRIDEHYEVVQK